MICPRSSPPVNHTCFPQRQHNITPNVGRLMLYKLVSAPGCHNVIHYTMLYVNIINNELPHLLL